MEKSIRNKKDTVKVKNRVKSRGKGGLLKKMEFSRTEFNDFTYNSCLGTGLKSENYRLKSFIFSKMEFRRLQEEVLTCNSC